MNKRICIVLWIIYILLLGCNRDAEYGTEGYGEFYIIDYEECLKTEQPMKISEIADSVEYLELKTPKDIIITHIGKVIPFNDRLIIHAYYCAYLFERNGQFIKQIGTKGQGPGEYIQIFDIDIDVQKNEIVISDQGKTLFYDMDGNYLHSQKECNFFRIGISDTVLWVGNLPDYMEKYLIYAVSMNNITDTITSIPSILYGMENLNNGRIITVASSNLSMFYYQKDILYFKGVESNDTIWKISGTQIDPYAYINMGKYKLPLEYEAGCSYDAFQKYANNYWGVPAILEDERYFFFFSEKRNTLKGDKKRYMMYDKKTKKGFVLGGSKKLAIIDDILEGPPLWPCWITDEYYISVVEWYKLQERMADGVYTPSASFKEQLSQFGEDTNQLIILCHRKNKSKE